ncbi:hypothetical protein JHK84_034004 [Glycine max]|nr:hypothetical protein JHK84_034004 [Glycine max]
MRIPYSGASSLRDVKKNIINVVEAEYVTWVMMMRNDTRRLSIYGVVYKGRDHVSNETITLKEISRGSYPNSNVSDSSSRDASMVGKHGYEPEIGSLKMDSKLPIDILENVMQLAIEGCKAIANYIRETLPVLWQPMPSA